MDDSCAMELQDYWITPDALRYSDMDGRPLGVIDLDACAPDAKPWPLPPFPLIGIGPSSHPLADRMDVLVEPPISVESLIRSIERAPKTTSVLVQLLRSIDALDIEAALTLESIGFGMLQGSAEHATWLGTQACLEIEAPGTVDVTRLGDVLHIALDRPSVLNAIDRKMRDELKEAFTVAAFDPDIRQVSLSGKGSAFSVGADLTEFGTTRDPATAHDIRMRTLPARALVRSGRPLEVHVQGACVGSGLELAAFASRLTAGRDAWFQLPELAMGIIPGAGGCVSVPRRIGRQRTALMILSGRRISTATALRWGLIDAIIDASPGDECRTDAI